MSAYKPRIKVLMPDKTRPFAALVQKVLRTEGHDRDAAAALGVSRTVLRRLIDDEYLTDKQARNILSGYRLWSARTANGLSTAQAEPGGAA